MARLAEWAVRKVIKAALQGLPGQSATCSCCVMLHAAPSFLLIAACSPSRPTTAGNVLGLKPP